MQRILATTSGSVLALATMALPATSANAQDASQTRATEAANEVDLPSTIIVTAQRREQRVNDIPIAVTAIGGDALRASGVEDVGDLTSTVPNMSMIAFYPARPEIAIRGVAMSESFLSTDQQPVGVYHDEVFEGSRAVHMSQIFDLQRVEIVRGPQGILFGRNTTAGALSFYSHQPDDTLGGYLEGTYGNFNSGQLEGALNLPVAEGLNARVSGLLRTSDGWAHNVNTNKRILSYDSYALRGIVAYDTGGSDWSLNVHGSRYRGDMNYYFQRDFGLAYNELSQRLRKAPENIDAFGANLTGKFSVGSVDFTTITAYEESQYFAIEDFGYGPTSIQNAGKFVQFNGFAIGYSDDFYQLSQELRAAGKIGNLDWIAGVFGYYENVDSTYSDGGYGSSTIGFDFNHNGVIDPPAEGWFAEDDRRIWNQKTKEIAGFLYGNYKISDVFSLLGGARLTYSKKELDWQYTDMIGGLDLVPKTHLEADWTALSARAGVEVRPQHGILLYGRYDRGFKNGGFNVGGSDLASLAKVDPERVNSFELGGKFTLFSGRAQLNLAAFHNTIKDYQANGAVESDSGLGFGFQNAATVKTKGVEVEFQASPVDGLQTYVNFGYTYAKFTSFMDTILGVDWSGNRVPGVPKYTLSTGVSYAYEMDNGFTITPAVDLAYQSKMEARHFNNPNEILDARSLLDARLRFASPGGKYFLQLWGKNLLNQEYLVKVLEGEHPGIETFAGGIQEKRGMPRTYGVSVGMKF